MDPWTIVTCVLAGLAYGYGGFLKGRKKGESLQPERLISALLWGITVAGVATYFGWTYPQAWASIEDAQRWAAFFIPTMGNVMIFDWPAKILVREIDARLDPKKSKHYWQLLMTILGATLPKPPLDPPPFPPPPDGEEG
jgi:hypothetical protein